MWGYKASKPLTKKKSVGVQAAGETPSITGEFGGETHKGLECARAHPPTWESPPEGPSLWVAKGVTEIRQRGEQAPLIPLGPSRMYRVPGEQQGLPGPGEYLRLRPFM